MRGKRAKAIRRMIGYDIKTEREKPNSERYDVMPQAEYKGALVCTGARFRYQHFKRWRKRNA